MMRHRLATPELEHLCVDAACGSATVSLKYSAGRVSYLSNRKSCIVVVGKVERA